jgi:hypothetical protein
MRPAHGFRQRGPQCVPLLGSGGGLHNFLELSGAARAKIS